MQIQLVDYTKDAEEKIAKYAAICYNASTEPEACNRRITKLLNLGHLATLRFGYATFLCSGISRACSHQLVRAKHLDFLQESQRYVKQKEIEFIYPWDELTEEQELEYAAAYRDAYASYQRLLQLGMKKEDARMVLPNATPTKLYVTGNFQAWKDFLKNRLDKAAQWEIRTLAAAIIFKLYEIAPTIFKPEYDQFMESVEVSMQEMQQGNLF